MTTNRTDVYTTITDRIVSQLDAGVRPWHQPWNARHKAGSINRPLRNNAKPYQGINVLVLWLTAFERGYTAPIWLTFQQAKELNGFVRKGEKGTTVVYANSFEKKETDAATGEETVERIPFLKSARREPGVLFAFARRNPATAVRAPSRAQVSSFSTPALRGTGRANLRLVRYATPRAFAALRSLSSTRILSEVGTEDSKGAKSSVPPSAKKLFLAKAINGANLLTAWDWSRREMEKKK